MPCSDGRAMDFWEQQARDQSKDDEIAELKAKLLKTEGMLCAVCNEAPEVTLDDAKFNGKCDDIEEWFDEHQARDRARLKQDGLPKDASHHENHLHGSMVKTYSIWSEGYAATGESGSAHKFGEARGISFTDAVVNFFKDRDDAHYLNSENTHYWGCKLFDNHADAAVSFG